MLAKKIVLPFRLLAVATALAALVCVSCGNRALADGPADNNPQTVRRIPRDGIEVPADREAELRKKLKTLQDRIEHARLLKAVSRTGLLPDVMIFERAVRCALDYNEFFHEREFDRADALLDEGLVRVNQLIADKPTWHQKRGLVVRGYVSRIDNTVQPYGLWVAHDYDLDRTVPARCDIWFHGRGETLSEVNFIWDRMKNAGRYTSDHTIVLHPYGRYCNAFKFAGETDVLEALEDVQRRYRIDEDRISVRGFSMGGAACWQFATHYSDRWFAANPGAGFSETPRFLDVFQKETLNPATWERALWNLYDCDKYAVNLMHCPTVAYSGEIDRQKQAADVMEEALAEHGIRLRHVIGAGMGHKIDDASKQVIESSIASLAKRGRQTIPAEIRFETHTLRYNRMHWLTVDGLIDHWKPATAHVWIEGTSDDVPPDEQRFVIKLDLTNVSAVSLNIPSGSIAVRERPVSATQPPEFGAFAEFRAPDDTASGSEDESGSKVKSWQLLPLNGPWSDGSLSLQAHQTQNGEWVAGPPPAGLRKRHGLQGPIDDAFMEPFVFVRPTGPSANEAAGKWAASELERAIEHWRRHFRGDARVVDDTQVTEELIQSANLVLWGEPSSNSVMKQLIDKLPIQWTAESISVGDDEFDAVNHVPVLICPNPLNPERYVVFNSSFTFRDYAYLNNARQVPMLPDWAVINLDTPPGTVWPGKVVAADFFNERWQLKD
jgi:dienelactone hydrolase